MLRQSNYRNQVLLGQEILKKSDVETYLGQLRVERRTHKTEQFLLTKQQHTATMIEAHHITQRLFIWFVVAMTILPKMPLDHSLSIGGKLSLPHRKIVLLLMVLNLTRMFLNREFFYNVIYSDALGVIEVVGLTFLSFVTPYLMKKWLSDFINVGNFGREMQFWVAVSAVMSIAGVVLSRVVSDRFWSLKKLANMVSSPYILMTVRQYQRVTTPSSGRGSVMAQSMVLTEYFHIVCQSIAAIGYAMKDPAHLNDGNQWQEILKAFRDVSFLGDWSRLLMHSIFLNVLDEMTQCRPASYFELGTEHSAPGSAVGDPGIEPTASEPLNPRDRFRRV